MGIAIITVNAFVIVVFVRFRSKILRRKNNRILLSMAWADFFVGVFSVTFAASMLADQDEAFYKSLGNIPLFGSMFISIFSLILLTFDRLFAIVKPLRYPSLITGKRLRMSLISSWFLTLLLLTQQYLLYFCFSSALELKVRGILLLIYFFAGVTVLGIANYILFLAIRQQIARLKMHSAQPKSEASSQIPGSEEPKANVFLISKKRRTEVNKCDLAASKECCYIVLIFIFLLVPLSVYRLLYTCGVRLGYRHVRRVFLFLALSSSFINPWIYFFKKRQFRKYYMSIARQEKFVDESSYAL